MHQLGNRAAERNADARSNGVLPQNDDQVVAAAGKPVIERALVLRGLFIGLPLSLLLWAAVYWLLRSLF